ncbi:hypothetical protein TNCV_989361 [Trichonephila clavipes]|nr:hypothetical protein TNCV_989361 [Trichonephila clavipes]
MFPISDGAAHVEYLGFLITAEGSRPLPGKSSQLIVQLQTTRDVIHDLRTFLSAGHDKRCEKIPKGLLHGTQAYLIQRAC